MVAVLLLRISLRTVNIPGERPTEFACLTLDVQVPRVGVTYLPEVELPYLQGEPGLMECAVDGRFGWRVQEDDPIVASTSILFAEYVRDESPLFVGGDDLRGAAQSQGAGVAAYYGEGEGVERAHLDFFRFGQTGGDAGAHLV